MLLFLIFLSVLVVEEVFQVVFHLHFGAELLQDLLSLLVSFVVELKHLAKYKLIKIGARSDLLTIYTQDPTEKQLPLSCVLQHA